MLQVVGRRNGKPVELFDDGASTQEFRSEGEGSFFETRESAEITLHHALKHGVRQIKTVEVVHSEHG